MKKFLCSRAASGAWFCLAALFATILTASAARAVDENEDLRADLSPLNQVPAVFAKSLGHFDAEIEEQGSISFTLSYKNMSSPVTGAHIHFGASKTNGGIIVFLCGGAKPACPADGTISGTITAADVSVLPATNGDSVIPQGIQPGNFAALLKAIRTANGYVNVHTTTFPNGEIRGQVKVQ
jgi:CHRD domain